MAVRGGNTIKKEEYDKLPAGVIAAGIISDSVDGILVDNTNKLLYYIVYKYGVDWVVKTIRLDTVKGMHEEEKVEFILSVGTAILEPLHIKRVFNASKKVMDLYLYHHKF